MGNFNGDIFCERANQLFGKTGQKELASKLSISQSVISDIINKNVKAPRADTIFSIANHFNVSADWLLGLTDVKSTDKATKEQLYNEGYIAGYNSLKNKIINFTEKI